MSAIHNSGFDEIKKNLKNSVILGIYKNENGGTNEDILMVCSIDFYELMRDEISKKYPSHSCQDFEESMMGVVLHCLCVSKY